MKGKIVAVLASLALASGVQADPYEPPRGSAERNELLTNLRAVTGYELGPPLEFVVDHMQVDGDIAMVMATGQRPGGVPIDIMQTPLVTRHGISPDFIDGTSVAAYFDRVAGKWYITEYAVGPTDVWWVGEPYCTDYATVMPSFGCPP